MKRIRNSVLLLFLLLPALALVGCVESLMQGKGGGLSKGARVDNPLKGVELDLAFADVMASMLRANDLLVNRVTISQDDEWPARLPLPEEDEAYEEWLEQRLAEDFSFFLYYGDVSFTDLLSINGLMQRPIIEAAQAVATRLEHQMEVISYLPQGCDGPVPAGAEAPRASYCQRLKDNRIGECPFFDEPLELQLNEYMLQGDIDSWVETPVKDKCLVRSKAVMGSVFNNFNRAFRSLLPQHLLQDYKQAEERIDELVAELRSLHEERVAAEKDKKPKAEVEELDARIKAVEQEIDRAENVYAKLMEEALASPEGTQANIGLARNLMYVAEAVYGNLDTASVGASAVLVKLAADIAYLTQAGLDLDRLTMAMSAEIQASGKAANREEARRMARERVELALRRVTLLLPNTVFLYTEIARQDTLMGPRVEYLAKLVELAEE
ncbi:MAG: hypothetical protein ACOCVM_01150 [Desulfovibrionaceae bacterium]